MVYSERKERSVQQGFTLIELVVAIMILGILSAIVGPPLFRYLGRARETAVTATLKQFKNAIREFHNDVKRYPRSLVELVVRPSGDPKAAKAWKGPYIGEEGKAEIPDDPWGNPYQYRTGTGDPQRPYELFSWGPGGEGSPRESWISVWDV